MLRVAEAARLSFNEVLALDYDVYVGLLLTQDAQTRASMEHERQREIELERKHKNKQSR